MQGRQQKGPEWDKVITLREVIDFLPDPLLLSESVDGRHRPLYVNSRFIETVGYSVEDIPDIDTWFEMAYPDKHYRDFVILQWEQARKQALDNRSNSVQVKARIRCKNGQDKWFHVRGSLWKKDIDIVLFSNIDEIEQKSQELVKLNNIKDKLLSIISHDVRGPLLTLRGLLDLVTTESLTIDEIRQLLPAVEHQIGGVTQLLDGLLFWANSQSESMVAQKNFFKLAEIIREAVDLVSLDSKKKSITCTVRMDSEPMVFADRKMAEVVLRNLLGNAVKFTPPHGQIRIKLETDHHDAFISIEDSGRGLTKEQIDKITNLVPHTSEGTAKEKGSGVGLLFSQEFVRRNGGNLWITSNQNQGSVFRFSLPLYDTSHQSAESFA